MIIRNSSRNIPAAVTAIGHERAVEILPGTLFALGGVFKIDGYTTWIARGASGWMPSQCYLFCDAENAILVDTGLPVHEASTRRLVAGLAADRPNRRLLITRREFDTLLNLPALVEDIGIGVVQSGGDINPLDFFESFDAATAREHFKATSGVEVDYVKPGSSQAVGSFEVTTLRSELRVLATNWLYEARTGTLFSSDTWAMMTCSEPGESVIASREEALAITTDDVIGHLSAKFDWSEGAETAGLIDSLRDLFTRFAVERICPTHGKIIEGKEAVTHLVAKTLEALEVLATGDRKSATARFDWPALAKACATA